MLQRAYEKWTWPGKRGWLVILAHGVSGISVTPYKNKTIANYLYGNKLFFGSRVLDIFLLGHQSAVPVSFPQYPPPPPQQDKKEKLCSQITDELEMSKTQIFKDASL